MIRHIVALQLSAGDDATRHHHASEMKRRLEELIDVVPGIASLEVHFDLGLVEIHWPVVLVSDFAPIEALEDYQAHPRHLEVVAWMNAGVVANRAVVDYKLD